MKTKKVIRNAMAMASLFVISGCTDNIDFNQLAPIDENMISLSSTILQEYESRASDDGFAEGDKMGIYIVDYQSQGVPGVLTLSSNRASNAPFTFDGGTKWTTPSPYYWKDDSTPIDVYGYYPFSNSISDVNAWNFEVSSDQNAEGAYEASDFLWAKAAGVAPTSNVINLKFTHRMAGVMVTLTKGESISDTEWEKVEKWVSVDNTVRNAYLDLCKGSVTPYGTVEKYIRMADQGDCVYRAIVVPQQIDKGVKLISITIDGTSYAYTRTEPIVLTSGKLHRFTLKIDKKDGGDYIVSLVSEEITPWENDKLSHSYLEYEYFVVTVTEPGTLKSTIEAMGKNIGEIKNLKVVGPLTTNDFNFMREEMSQLAMLNIKEVICKDIVYQYDWDQDYRTEVMQNVIPQGALVNKESLRRIVLPDNVTRICDNAFRGIGLDINSSVILPKHLKRIDGGAFANIGEAGELVLNDELEYIGNEAFARSAFTCELNLPQTLRHIGINAFGNDMNNSYFMRFKGHFILPDNLEYYGGPNFEGNYGGPFVGVSMDEVGEIIVPEITTTLEYGMFPSFTKGCYVSLHGGIKRINCLTGRFINYVEIPEGVTNLGREAFYCSEFCAGVSLPSSLITLEERVFSSCRGIGDLEMPENICYISTECFESADITSIKLSDKTMIIQNRAFLNSNLQSIEIGKNCDFIGSSAFENCERLTRIVCHNPKPPIIDGNDVFNGCFLDQLVLEVPVGSVELYRNAQGWNRINFITEYHELAVGTSQLTCLNNGLTYNTLVRSESSWSVTECPSWCHVSPASSNDRRTEIAITIDKSGPGESREGNIVFKLNNSDYSTFTKVNQQSYELTEDSEVIFQKASSSTKEIPIFIFGDGFDATDILNGTYIEAMHQAYDNIVSIEPFKTYKDYFTISTSIAISPNSGFEDNYLRTNKFHTAMGPLGIIWYPDKLIDYAKKISAGINDDNLSKSLIICVMNSNSFAAAVQQDRPESNVTLCCYSTDSYPYDFRGLLQHYALGRGFGRLAHETISHYTFLKGCTCSFCNQYLTLLDGQAKGWYQNISLKGSLNSVPWSHLVFHEKYSDIVDVYEGAWNHANGVYRSENMSVMNTYIPYFNTYCRELIVRRIKEYVGEQFSFEEFVAKDSREGNPN